MEKAESASRITKDQIERLIQIMEQNPDVAKGVCVNPASFWHEVSMELNSLGPAKDKYSWKKTWTDKKSNIKKKYNQIKNERNKTGGGIPLAIRLNNIEERILNITSIKSNVNGVKDSICIGAPENQPTNEQNNEEFDANSACSVSYAESSIAKVIAHDALEAEPITSNPKPTRTKPQVQKQQKHNTMSNNPDEYQQILIDQNKAIAEAVVDIASTMKMFAIETLKFQKELLEVMKETKGS